MSYILDALRRADAERSRGAVPGLHAQSLPADAEPAARNYAPLLWAAGGAGVLLAAGVAVLLWAPWRGAPAPDASVARALVPSAAPALAARDPVPTARAPGELPPPGPGALEPAARPVAPPLARAPRPYLPQADERGTQPYPPPPNSRPTRFEAPPAVQPAPSPAPNPARAAAPTPTRVEHYGAAVSPAPAPTAAAVPNINTLPPDVRAKLPRLAVGGAIYSETPSARMVILNGQVFHEGDKPAADTVLEQIRLKSAILNFRGQRYEVSF